jgi:hypothetical protein
MNKILVSIDADGKAVAAITVSYPDEYTHEGTEEVRQNLERAQHTPDGWVIHDPLQLVLSAETVQTGDEVTATVTLPTNTPDSEVEFVVSYDGESLDPEVVAVSSGKAVATFSFEQPGVYRVTARSRFHGVATKGVTVSEAPAE